MCEMLLTCFMLLKILNENVKKRKYRCEKERNFQIVAYNFLI